jgi:hypothetical protein
VADEVDRLGELVGDVERLLAHVQRAQEAFRVGDVAAASQTMNGLASLVDQIHGEVDLLVSELPPPSASV